jgi:hypothetical protein
MFLNSNLCMEIFFYFFYRYFTNWLNVSLMSCKIYSGYHALLTVRTMKLFTKTKQYEKIYSIHIKIGTPPSQNQSGFLAVSVSFFVLVLKI